MCSARTVRGSFPYGCIIKIWGIYGRCVAGVIKVYMCINNRRLMSVKNKRESEYCVKR